MEGLRAEAEKGLLLLAVILKPVYRLVCLEVLINYKTCDPSELRKHYGVTLVQAGVNSFTNAGLLRAFKCEGAWSTLVWGGGLSVLS